jgi:hypothetical protein
VAAVAAVTREAKNVNRSDQENGWLLLLLLLFARFMGQKMTDQVPRLPDGRILTERILLLNLRLLFYVRDKAIRSKSVAKQ